MHPLPRLLTLLLPTLTTTTTLNFDSIPTPHGLAPLPTPYHNLTFHRASVFNPLSPSLRNIITPHDHNCAVSAPNALIGSRDTEGGAGLTFSISSENGNGTFALKRFWVKPMDFPAGGDVVVRVLGYRGDAGGPTAIANGDADDEGEDVVKWQVEFPVGYHLPFLAKMDEYSRDDWTGLRSVEVVADYGVQELDWEVCLDDLVVEFELGGGGKRAGEGWEGWKGRSCWRMPGR